jgi:hypothetical protein
MIHADAPMQNLVKLSIAKDRIEPFFSAPAAESAREAAIITQLNTRWHLS